MSVVQVSLESFALASSLPSFLTSFLSFSSSEADEFLGGAVGKFISSLTEFAANSPINQGKM